MNIVQAPAGAVPFMPLQSYKPLHVQTFMKALQYRIEASRKGSRDLLPTTKELSAAVSEEQSVPIEEVVKAIEELRGDGTLLMLPDGRLLYCSDD